MTIITVDPPTRKSSGRRPRLSDEDIQDLINAVQAGAWGTDGEAVTTKTGAYQRAQAARKLVAERGEIKIETITTSATEAAAIPNPNAGQEGEPDTLSQFNWAIGPAGQTPEGS